MMVEPAVVTLFPLGFLVVLFGGGILMKRRNINMDGEPPIEKKVFYISKYLILGLWCAMVVQSWGIRLSFMSVPGWLKSLSVLLWICGFTLLFIGRFGLAESFRIGSPNESTGLKVNGLYHFSRNPMYVGVYTTILACVLYTLNPIFLVVGVFVVAVHHKIVLAEEQYLQKVFGQEYADFCRRVRRYL
jgi:protein-S-isoprenylcysteine O-methyltransferase Ste14